MNVQDINTINWQMSTSAPDTVVEGVDDVRQCIDTILKTRKGEDPLRPHFGCGLFDWIDKPNTSAVPNMKKEILQAIKAYEPRITITSIQHEIVTGGIKFVIIFKNSDGSADSFDFATNGIGSNATPAPATLVLQASYDDTSVRFYLDLRLDGLSALPSAPTSGFPGIAELLSWANNNWGSYGKWYSIYEQEKIVLYVPNSIASTGALSIESSTNVLTASINPLVQADGYYRVYFLDSEENLILPLNDDTVVNKGSILSFVQDNYAAYGYWSIDGDSLILKGSVIDLAGFTLQVLEVSAVPAAFTTGFSLGFQS